MLCCPHCSQLSTILNNIVTPDSGSTILLTSVNNVGSKSLFNPVEQRARRFLPCSVGYLRLTLFLYELTKIFCAGEELRHRAA
jgi:hypothetical protein